jgi:hypothetical protein
MQKVKSLANQSKFINYREVAEFTQNVEGDQGGDWDQCLAFMRDNPKLMM